MNQETPVPADSNLHHVIAAPATDVDPGKLAKKLAPALGRVPFDETYRLKNCGGWWLRGGSKEMSSKVVEVANSQGFHTREWVQEQEATRLRTHRTIRTRLEDDRIELITPTDSRWIPLSSIRAIDMSLAAEDDDPENENLSQQRERVTRSLAELMLPGTPAGDLLEKISEAPIRNPRPRLFLLGQGDLCWSMDRSTVFLDLVQQRAAQSLANILRFTGLLIGSVSDEVVTPQTRRFWIEGNLDCIRRDVDSCQTNRIEAIRGWLDAGGQIHDHSTDPIAPLGKEDSPLSTKGDSPS